MTDEMAGYMEWAEPDDLRTGLARAIGDSVAVHDEGAEPRLFELLDYSGENKARLVLIAAADAALAHVTARLESEAMVERVARELAAQMEAQADDTTPSSIQREKGLIWFDGWLDLRAVIAAQVAAMKGEGPLPAPPVTGEG